jgi:hypothetical protein
VLEGIKEGVQGVSRFIATGLGEFHVSSPAPPSRGHVLHQSNSSISTYATKSTRFSQSSMSSVGDDPHSAQDSPSEEEEILMVHDTGATPTMSPNFKFAHQRQLEEEKARQDSAHSDARSQIGAADTNDSAARLHCRKSCEVARSVSPPCTTVSKSELSPNSPSINSASVNYGNLSSGQPPMSSLPGLGVAAPSWVDSVSRKWEELQTFSMSQKRASVLLSDVSQTIVSALSPPLTSSSGPMATPPPFSLLDDDDNPTEGMRSVMKPDSSTALSSSQAVSSPRDFDDEWNW